MDEEKDTWEKFLQERKEEIRKKKLREYVEEANDIEWIIDNQ